MPPIRNADGEPVSHYDVLLDRITARLSLRHELVIGSDEHGVHLSVLNPSHHPVAGWTERTLYDVLASAAREVDPSPVSLQEGGSDVRP